MTHDDMDTQTLSASYVAQVDVAYREYLKAKLKSEQRRDRQIIWSVRLSAAAIVIVALAMLTACAEGPTEKCLRYGFQPHTDAYATCLMTLDQR